jgi:ABC-2 type transport system ATP-binding protein
VSLSVRPGEVVGLLGGNGAGKTTLMRILLGLDSATTGSPRLFDSKPSLESRRRIGYVAQGLGLYPALSAMENLQFSASVYGVRVGPQATAYAQSLGRSPVGCLPLGARRILAYLAATEHDPDLLVLDEPTSAMDALTRARLWRDLRSSADRGVGVLVTTHYMQEAAQCDRLVLLTSGRVSAMGSADQITSPYSSVTVTTANWRAAFTLLRDAGIPALLDGRTLRAPGANPAQIESLLAPLADPARIRTAAATLEETMVLAARDPVP